MTEANEHTEYDPADLEAIRAQGHSVFREDAGIEFGGSSLIFARQLDYVKSKAYSKKFPDMKASVLVPDNTDTPEWAETITVMSYDQVGMAKIIANYADDLPRVDVRAMGKTINVKTIGDSYGYNYNEIKASRATGIGLDSKKAEAARRATELKLNKIKLVGDEEYGLFGLFNHPNIPVIVLPHPGSWNALSGDQVLENLIAMQDAFWQQNKGVHAATFLALASVAYSACVTKQLSAGIMPTSPLTYYKALYPDTKVERVYECEGIGLPNLPGVDVALLYEQSVDNISHELVMPFTQLPPEARNLEFVINCLAKSGGVQVYYPLALLFAATS